MNIGLIAQPLTSFTIKRALWLECMTKHDRFVCEKPSIGNKLSERKPAELRLLGVMKHSLIHVARDIMKMRDLWNGAA